MKPSVLIFLLLLSILFACKKTVDVGLHSASAVVNNEAVTFTNTYAFKDTPFTNVYEVLVWGQYGTGSNLHKIVLDIQSAKPVSNGIYTTLSALASNGGSPSINYILPNGAIYANVNYSTSNATITVTSITGTSVQGTFGGTLNLTSNGTGPATSTITDGKFNATFK